MRYNPEYARPTLHLPKSAMRRRGCRRRYTITVASRLHSREMAHEIRMARRKHFAQRGLGEIDIVSIKVRCEPAR